MTSLLLGLFFSAGISFGSSTKCQISELSDQYRLNQCIKYFIDSTGVSTINNVIENGQFSPLPFTQNQGLGLYDGAIWLQLKIESKLNQPHTYLISFKDPHVNDFDYYQLSSDTMIHKRAGRFTLRKDLDIDHPYPVFRIYLEPGEVYQLYFRYTSEDNPMINVVLEDPVAFASEAQARSSEFYIVNTILFCVIIFGIIIFTFVRQRFVLLYSIFLLLAILHNLSSEGLLALYLFDGIDLLSSRSNFHIGGAGYTIFILFTREFLDTKRKLIYWDYVLVTLCTIVFIFFIGTFFINNASILLKIGSWLILLVLLSVAIITILLIIKKDRDAYFYMASLSGIILSWILSLLKVLNVLPYMPDSVNFSYYLSLGVQILAIFGGIARRLQLLYREKEQTLIENAALEKLNKSKSRFFTNVSHEFRTPLTLILGTLERLRKEIQNLKVSEYYNIIEQNAHRLLSLVNQLLDLSKVESGHLTLRASYIKINETINGLVNAFQPICDQKGVGLIFKENQEITGYFDPDNLEKVITNLVSNAVKYTDEGTITISLIKSKSKESGFPEGAAIIQIADTGKGIKNQYLSKIFDHFYMAGHEGSNPVGSGVGLSLTKELVNIHHGSIHVESEEGIGSTFTVKLPLGKSIFSENEIAHDTSNPSPSSITLSTPNNEFLYDPEAGNLALADKINHNIPRPKVLLVEDHMQVRSLVRSLLDTQYEIIECDEGNAGIELSIKHVPDLIISDIMMPGMNGIEMLKSIKLDLRTSHIPIIMLTAKASDENLLEGLKYGADDYLIKPFKSQELILRTNNLINARKKLQKYLCSELFAVSNKKIQQSKIDNAFIQQIVDLVNKRISESSFDINTLCKEIGMSRTSLHMKLKALTGQSTSTFVRNIRLKNAYDILRDEPVTVSTVAYRVGFNNLSYFTKCFKETHGQLPSEAGGL